MLIRLGYRGGVIENINVEDNYFEVYGYGSLIKFGSKGVERVNNIRVTNNTIKYHKIDGEGFSLFQIDNTEGQNIQVDSNVISIDSEINERIAGSCLVGENIDFLNNKVTIDYNLAYLAIRGGNFCNNDIKISGNLNNFFIYTNNSLTKNIKISNNKFEINDSESWNKREKIFLGLQNTYLNGFYILINENTLTLSNNQELPQTFVNFNSINDETVQKVYSYNNNLGIFTEIINYMNNIEHIVINQMP